ncbi:CTP synthetase [Rhodobacteraceae bacterium KMM 6894]|nr:CTP synthetase [Rhodobacteraceae bacterium KMM 6894]
MGWLILILHVFIGSTIAGSLIIAALVIGQDSMAVLIGAAIAGFVLAVPISWLLAKQLTE